METYNAAENSHPVTWHCTVLQDVLYEKRMQNGALEHLQEHYDEGPIHVPTQTHPEKVHDESVPGPSHRMVDVKEVIDCPPPSARCQNCIYRLGEHAAASALRQLRN